MSAAADAPGCVAVVGGGLIGASLLDLAVAAWPGARTVAVDTNPAHRAVLGERFPGATVSDDLAAAFEADLVFVCTPVSAIAPLVCRLADGLGPEAVVVDAGSVKASVLAAVRAGCPGFDRFVPGHPMAGGTSAGPAAADGDLLRGKPFLLTPDEGVAPAALERARAWVAALGTVPAVVPADEHDGFVALSSHLTHLFAYALVARYERMAGEAAGQPGEPEAALAAARHYLGGSFYATSRYAASDPALWADIFLANGARLRDQAQALTAEMRAILDLVEAGDAAALAARLGEAAAARRTLETDGQ